ncbi:stress-response A/B barrel domain-containing protein At5g22580 [Silene latifolia]|uniref:stress-response A/B barrel domain-containing protein At5g22580 n=1 Tax=Silene latifolia TaxID=37657 RepID=UPI003D780013
MGEFKHLVVAKFKEGVVVDDIIKGMQDLVSDVDSVKSFEWGQDVESHEMLRQGFTHSFLMSFDNKEDFIAFMSHPKHVEFSSTFSAAIEKVVLLDFSRVLAKPIKPAVPEVPPAAETPAPPA